MVILLIKMDDHLFERLKMDGTESKEQGEGQTYARRSEEMEKIWATNNETIRIYILEMAVTTFALLKMEWRDMEETLHTMMFERRIEEMAEILEFFLAMMEI